jgi:RNA polymerase sigma-70 factor (ECF subfamily)
MSDEELLNSYRTLGDDRLLGLLLQRYTMLLFGVSMKYLKDKDTAQDAVQQVFLKAITHLPRGEVQNFKGWLYILMRNHCLQLLRDRHITANEDALRTVAAQPADSEAIMNKERTLDKMHAALQQLGEEQRLCISLFYLQKLSYNDIIECTGFTFTQVKSYIQNGKRNLRILLTKNREGDNS